MAFLAASWGGVVGVLLCEWIFLHVMVGGGRGTGGSEGIDGICWRCHRRQGLLSSATTFRRGWSIVVYDMSKYCGWWHWKILKDPFRTWSQFWNGNGRNKFFSPCSKNSVYHPFHSKLHSDYLKKTLVDLNCIYISEQISNRTIYRYSFVRVHRRFLKIIRPPCCFCGNLQHLLHVVKRLLRIYRIQIEPTRFWVK